MDNLEFLDGSEEPNAEPVETAEAPAEAPTQEAEEPTETEAQTQQRERDEKGRFKPKEQEQPVMVPLQALHETRDEVKALKAQLAALAQPQQQAPQVPDVFENPEGFTGHIQNQIAQAQVNTILNVSEEMARASVGNEIVDAAQQWGKEAFQANPALAQQFFSQRNPYGFLVQEYQRQQTLAQLGNADPKEIEAFLAWKAAQGQVQQPGAQPNPQQSPPPPRSIASATSAGGLQQIATGPTAAFDEIFTR